VKNRDSSVDQLGTNYNGQDDEAGIFFFISIEENLGYYYVKFQINLTVQMSSGRNGHRIVNGQQATTDIRHDTDDRSTSSSYVLVQIGFMISTQSYLKILTGNC
jgi:hypothetical protein